MALSVESKHKRSPYIGLRPCKKREKRKTPNIQEEVSESLEDPVPIYKAECVRLARGSLSNRQFLIKWAGYPESENTWEAEEGVKHLDCVKEFLSRPLSSATGKRNKRKLQKVDFEENNGKKQMNWKEAEEKYGRIGVPLRKNNRSKKAQMRFAAQDVIAIRGEGATREFLIRWEGYGPDEDTWEPESGVRQLDIVKEALRLVGEQQKQLSSRPKRMNSANKHQPVQVDSDLPVAPPLRPNDSKLQTLKTPLLRICDLCSRSFCNSKFLRIHRANKHEIYDSTLLTSPSGAPERLKSISKSSRFGERSRLDSSFVVESTDKIGVELSQIGPTFNNNESGAIPERISIQLDEEFYQNFNERITMTKKLVASRQGRLKTQYRAQKAQLLVLPALQTVLDEFLNISSELEVNQEDCVEKTAYPDRPIRRISNQTGIRFSVLRDIARPTLKILPITRKVSTAVRSSRLFDFIPFPAP